MKLKSIPRRLGYILGAQWTRDLSWTIFTILLARRSPDIMGQIVLALTYGYLVKTVADVGLNDFLLSTFARREGRPRALLGEVSWLKMVVLLAALGVTWLITGWQHYTPELRLIVFCIAAGLGLTAPAVVFAGMVEPAQVADWYQLGDLFVSASTSETQGLTYIEALAAGTPALCRADPCLAGVLREGENGWQYRDAADFRRKLADFIAHPERRESLSAAPGGR